MSCTLVLVPITIGPTLIASLMSSVVLSGIATYNTHKEFEEDTVGAQTFQDDYFVRNAMNKHYEAQPTLCSQYKTIFKDSNLLIKTLSEHCVQNIVEQDGKIYGNLDALQFEFVKGEDGIYDMNITHGDNADLGIVNELNDEYQMNVQEKSYNTIKENLQKHSLKIDNEEVLEDNSIMLTVNLD